MRGCERNRLTHGPAFSVLVLVELQKLHRHAARRQRDVRHCRDNELFCLSVGWILVSPIATGGDRPVTELVKWALQKEWAMYLLKDTT